jgi:hypothetical protein
MQQIGISSYEKSKFSPTVTKGNQTFDTFPMRIIPTRPNLFCFFDISLNSIYCEWVYKENEHKMGLLYTK